MADPAATAVATTQEVDPAVEEIVAALDSLVHVATRTRAHEQLLRHAGVDIDRAGAGVLRQLLACDGDMRLGQLADRLAIDAPGVTRKVQQLEREGLVSRTPDPEDGRASRVRLTPDGRRVMDRLLAAKRERLGEALASWSAAERTTFARLLEQFASSVTTDMEGM